MLALGSTLYTQMLLCYMVCQARLEAEGTASQPPTYAATFCDFWRPMPFLMVTLNGPRERHLWLPYVGINLEGAT